MKKNILAIALLLISLKGASQLTYNNPILSGFYPDPSICRVDKDYYITTSSFAYFPGLPIFHSTDLVNWKQVGHALDRPEQLDLKGAGVSRGLFAPTIRYHKGIFYIICTLIDKGGNFVITAKDPYILIIMTRLIFYSTAFHQTIFLCMMATEPYACLNLTLQTLK